MAINDCWHYNKETNQKTIKSISISKESFQFCLLSIRFFMFFLLLMMPLFLNISISFSPTLSSRHVIPKYFIPLFSSGHDFIFDKNGKISMNILVMILNSDSINGVIFWQIFQVTNLGVERYGKDVLFCGKLGLQDRIFSLHFVLSYWSEWPSVDKFLEPGGREVEIPETFLRKLIRIDIWTDISFGKGVCEVEEVGPL